ncbi:unnamed protein product [Clonostachys rhizophaga]|uniref:Carboxylic ester hydrolase n=1 Tax=Clonostachys rhizophaga TaxID=160324 RepID=A0A9N9V4C6_9HYPO|nr:unnamed protein product [Clonostachys rhizophaga]
MKFALLAFLGLAAAAPHVGGSVGDCASFTLTEKFSEFKVVSVKSVESTIAYQGASKSICNVTVVTSHSCATDHVYNYFWLPLEEWDGRLVVMGGGNFATMDSGQFGPLIAGGYVSAATEGGLSLNGTIDPGLGGWIAKADGTVNQGLFKNFAYRALHDLTLISKAVSKAFYGSKPNYSYYNGCSTGGRMGYDAAWHYPQDFDGIVAGAPALYIPDLVAGDMWPQVVMQNTVAPPQCVWNHYLTATIEACDLDDGVADKLISRPDLCKFNPSSQVGKTIDCTDTGGQVTITEGYSNVIRETYAGPKSQNGEFIWYGLPVGSLFQAIAYTYTQKNVTYPYPMSLASPYINKLFLQNSTFDINSISYDEFEHIHKTARELYSFRLGGDGSDLAAFKAAGGKLLSYHALNDPIIPHDGTVQFWEREQQSDANVADWYRLFMYAGGGHCGSNYYPGWGNYGFLINNPLPDLIDWVEKGKAPDVLSSYVPSITKTIERGVCSHPKRITYKGTGDINSVDSFHCV